VHARIADDAAGLAAATIAALGDRHDPMIDKGRALVEANHTWDAQADRLLAAVRTLR
jgi:hypothetical protein